jgi:hypothetical protein
VSACRTACEAIVHISITDTLGTEKQLVIQFSTIERLVYMHSNVSGCINLSCSLQKGFHY